MSEKYGDKETSNVVALEKQVRGWKGEILIVEYVCGIPGFKITSLKGKNANAGIPKTATNKLL